MGGLREVMSGLVDVQQPIFHSGNCFVRSKSIAHEISGRLCRGRVVGLWIHDRAEGARVKRH